MYKMISIAGIAIAYYFVFDIANSGEPGAGTTSANWAKIDGENLWTWTKDWVDLPTLAVHRLVIPILEPSEQQVTDKMGEKPKDRFPVQLQNDAMEEIKQSALKHKLNLDQDIIYPILVVGTGPKCGKAVALNAMLTADPNEPGPIPINDGLLNPQFPLSSNEPRPDHQGIWASDVFKRYGNYYILLMVRYPSSNDDVNPSAGYRLTALGHYLSSGMALITALPSFQHGRADLLAAAAALAVQDSDEKCRQSSLPTVGIRLERDEEGRGPTPFKDEFSINTLSKNKGRETVQATAELLQSFEPIGESFLYNKTPLRIAKDFCENPGDYFRKSRTSSDSDAMIHCENYRTFVGAGEKLMKHVIGKKRTATFNGLQLLLSEMIPNLNHENLDSKSLLSQIGENVCGTTINKMIEEDDNRMEAKLSSKMYDQSESKITDLLKEFEKKFKNELERRLGTVWSLIEYGCDDAFHKAFESMQKRIERRLKFAEHEEKLQERAEKEKERELRIAVEKKNKALQMQLDKERAFKNTMNWCWEHWRELLFGFIAFVVIACLIKPCFRLVKCFNKVSDVGSKSKESKRINRKLNEIETMLDTKIRAMDIEAHVPIKRE